MNLQIYSHAAEVTLTIFCGGRGIRQADTDVGWIRPRYVDKAKEKQQRASSHVLRRNHFHIYRALLRIGSLWYATSLSSVFQRRLIELIIAIAV
jgi:hypothetical protein